jgi:ketosteroid isomerase-like protein
MASTKDILDHHLKAFDQGDLNGVLSDYAPDAVLFTKNGALKGVDKMTALLPAVTAKAAGNQ